MVYIDAFVLPVKKRNVAAYVKMAKLGKRVWMKHGALQFVESQLNDAKTMPGVLSFPKLAKSKADETVFFSYIVYKNKAHRTKVTKAVMAEFSTMRWPKTMPHDHKRMAFGGFLSRVYA